MNSAYFEMQLILKDRGLSKTTYSQGLVSGQRSRPAESEADGEVFLKMKHQLSLLIHLPQYNFFVTIILDHLNFPLSHNSPPKFPLPPFLFLLCLRYFIPTFFTFWLYRNVSRVGCLTCCSLLTNYPRLHKSDSLSAIFAALPATNPLVEEGVTIKRKITLRDQ